VVLFLMLMPLTRWATSPDTCNHSSALIYLPVYAFRSLHPISHLLQHETSAMHNSDESGLPYTKIPT
jgi:hypothetical protein